MDTIASLRSDAVGRPLHPAARWLLRRSLPLQRVVLRRRVGRLVIERLDGVPLVILPEVFNPVVFRTTGPLVRSIPVPPPGAPRPRALDMGTGSGAGAVFAARAGYEVVAVDINEAAVRCVRINALLNGLHDHIEARHGDLFAPVEGQRFDLVLFNPPFFRGSPRNALDMAWRSVDVLERFADGLAGVLGPGGRARVVLSTDGACAALLATLSAAGFDLEPVYRRDLGNEIVTVHDVRRGRGA